VQECQTLTERLLLVLALHSETQLSMQPPKATFESSHYFVEIEGAECRHFRLD
jgi:hypothetical protein